MTTHGKRPKAKIARDPVRRSASSQWLAKSERAIAKWAPLVTACTFAGACLVGLGLLVLNLVPAYNSVRGLLELAEHPTQFHAGPLSFVFDEPTLGRAVKIEFGKDRQLEQDYMASIVEAIHSLDAEKYRRFMYIEGLSNLCDYSNPTLSMRRDLAADWELEDLGLVEIKIVPELPDAITSLSRRIDSDIGLPRYCYLIKLTDKGRDVKTALVRTLGSLLKGDQHMLRQ
jgi:hypothetical protein